MKMHLSKPVLRAAVAAVLAALLTMPILIAHAGQGPGGTPAPSAPGWMADPVTVPVSAVPQWAQALAQTAVTTLSSDPSYQHDVAELAVHLYQHCLSVPRCQPPTLAAVQGTGGSAASVVGNKIHPALTVRAIQPASVSDSRTGIRPRAYVGSPYSGQSGTATYVMSNTTPAGYDSYNNALIEPGGGPPAGILILPVWSWRGPCPGPQLDRGRLGEPAGQQLSLVP